MKMYTVEGNMAHYWTTGFGISNSATCGNCVFLKLVKREYRCQLFLTEERPLGENQMPLKTEKGDSDLPLRCPGCCSYFPHGADMDIVATRVFGETAGDET